MSTKKKILVSLLATSVIATAFSLGAFAATKTKLLVNGKAANVDTQVIKNTTYVPLRAVSEMLGAQVGYDQSTQTVSITLNNNSASSDKGVVASVNGTNITKDDLYNALIEQGGVATLSNLITRSLIEQDAKKHNITVTEADINKELGKIKQNAGGEASFAKMLAQYNMTVDQLRKELISQIQMTKLLSSKVTVTDDEMQQYYDKNKQSFSTPEEVRASHILVKTEAEAQDILKQLKEGADFATLAQQKSLDPGSKNNGGDLNFFTKGQMVQSFEEAAFSLKVGELSGIVKSDYGYHIIKVTDRKATVTPPFAEKKAEINDTLLQQKISQMTQSYIAELTAKATITNTLDPK